MTVGGNPDLRLHDDRHVGGSLHAEATFVHHFVLTPQGSAGAQQEVAVGRLRLGIAAQEEMHVWGAEEGQEARRDVDRGEDTRERQGTRDRKAQAQVRVPLKG